MFLARVEGAIVATKKDPSMSGRKMLLLRPQLVDDKDPTKFRPGANTIVAVDSVGAGIGEMVMFTQGSSARLAPGAGEGCLVEGDRQLAAEVARQRLVEIDNVLGRLDRHGGVQPGGRRGDFDGVEGPRLIVEQAVGALGLPLHARHARETGDLRSRRLEGQQPRAGVEDDRLLPRQVDDRA